ncbi:MAG: SpoIIE family protein phosphatase [Rhodospirillales bacterium]|jgi:serine phosphatase RsbU (regulator of sigma subunit)/PAS domain-containing protein|nr:SpoIIE family protein phosphatase [Rhodospirillales bacterium]
MDIEAPPDRKKTMAFPKRTFQVLVISTLSLIILFLWEQRNMVTRMQEMEELSVKSTRVAQQVIYYDEALTMSMWMAIIGSEKKWVHRYFEFADQLDATIATIKKELPSDLTTNFFEKAGVATEVLYDLEEKAFSHIEAGRPDLAKKIIESERYSLHKQLYSTGVRYFVNDVDAFNEKQRQDMEADQRRILYVAVGGILLIFVSWVYLYRVQRRIIEENVSLSDNLEQERDLLEEHVRERTSDLAESETRIRAVMNAIDYGVIFMDADLRASVINQACLDIWKFDKSVMTSRPTMTDLMQLNRHTNTYRVADEDFDKFVEDRVAIVHAGPIQPTEMELADGRILRYQNVVLPDGGRMLTYLDITELKRAERDLAAAFEIISGSIVYASRIQRSILPPAETLSSTVPENFVLWEPRDTVGGDMYWCRNWGNGILILLGDCTGHGVPGAFMTLIANGALNEAYLEVPPGDAATLLQRMHQLIQLALGQNRSEGDSDDGLEAGVCFLQPGRAALTFAGARFSLFVSENGEVREIKGDKSGLGYRGIPQNVSFTNQSVDLAADALYYMTSDGLIDQIGGEKKRSYGKRRFKELLTSIREMSMTEQKDRIQQALSDWQGDQMRRDDVSVLGFKGGNI